MRLISDDIWVILTIRMEAGGEPMEGKIGVAEVIRNRIEQKVHSDGTVVGTILRPMQFSCWNENNPSRVIAALSDTSDPTVLDCNLAWHHAMLRRTNLTNGALFYFNPELAKPKWASQYHRTAHIGRHEFYAPHGPGL
jgi:N-acetylmuramoyl-L-alanine amidase